MPAQILLDSILPPLKKKFRRNLKANSLLSQQEVNDLYQIVDDFEAQEESYDFHSALRYVSGVVVPNVAKPVKGVVIAPAPQTMPFLVKQVLFYIAVACKFYKVNGQPLATQADIINELAANGLKLSHNFYTKMYLTPTEFVNLCSYKPPELPFKYLGQKHEAYGYALRNLIYQHGTYDVFVDLFGGSGGATVSFPRRNNAIYIYNDTYKPLAVLMEVVADNNKYLALMEDLKELQELMRGSYDGTGSSLFVDEATLDKDLEDFISYRRGKRSEAEYALCEYFLSDRILVDDKGSHLDSVNVYDIIKDWMLEYKKVIDDDTGIQKCLQNKLPKQNELKRGSLNDVFDNPYIGFYKYFDALMEVLRIYPSKFSIKPFHYEVVDRNKNTMLEDILTTQDRLLNLRVYEYYAHYMNYLRGSFSSSPTPAPAIPQDDITTSIAVILENSFLINGKTSISAVVNFNNTVVDFLARDFDTILTELHGRLSTSEARLLGKTNKKQRSNTRFIVKNGDYNVVLNGYKSSGVATIKHNKPLFYSDSPYVETTGYHNSFTSSDVETLIDRLIATGDDFIFSCRAGIGTSTGTKLSTEEIQRRNEEIVKHVYKPFHKAFKKSKPFYVLMIDATGRGFIKNLRGSRVTEIMITNFEICSFDISNAPKSEVAKFKKASFEVCRFDDFLKGVVDGNLILSAPLKDLLK